MSPVQFEDQDAAGRRRRAEDLRSVIRERRRAVFTCPTCGRTSAHPEDLAEGYCGACHDWTGPGTEGGP